MKRWSSPALEEVADLIRETTGLTFPDIRVADVEATIMRAMKQRDVRDPRSFVQLLRSDAEVREALVAELTIGETYFQRDPAQIQLLREELLPALLARGPADRPVRVWSAGCASGEEPYSVAMLFEELDALDRCEIRGTDIARDRLRDAQRGIYSRWSLRSTPPELQRRYFRERGRFYELTPRIRKHVDFRYLNLAEDRFPSLSVGIWGMDVILCRNVLIYFDEDTVRQVASRLIASLSEDGWLVLGASDPAISELVDCDVVLTDAGVVYRRPGAAGGGAASRPHRSAQRPPGESAAAPESEVQSGTMPRDESPSLDEAAADALFGTLAAALAGELEAPDSQDNAGAASDASSGSGAAGPGPAMEAAYARRDFDAVTALGAAAGRALDAGGWVVWIRALANQGALDEAGRIASRALETHGPTAELLYLHGVLLLEAGLPTDAAAALRRSLYLDRTLAVAHLTLADAQQRMGSAEAARRSLRNAATLLDAMPAEASVPAADGETAGRLRELVRVKARLLSDAASVS